MEITKIHLGTTRYDDFGRPLVSPKGWADAGVGIEIGWVGGIPLIESKNKMHFSNSVDRKLPTNSFRV